MFHILFLSLTACSSAFAAPAELAYNGRLLDPTGVPVTGPHTLVITLYDGADAGATAHWTRTFANVPVDDGYFSLVLTTDNAGQAIDTAWLAADLWVGVSVDGTELIRQQLVDVPRAALATHIPVVSSGQANACTDTGAIAWDTSVDGLRVCDGATWRRVGADPFVIDSGARRWADGSVAESCRDYNAPPAGVLFSGAVDDGLYWIDPDGSGGAYGEMQVYCDQTRDGGGWTRVSTVILTGQCTFTTGAAGDPAVGGNCTKYADALINEIAQDKIFVSRVPGYASTYTKYADAIRVDGTPGLVVQGGALSDVAGATPTYTIGYGGWLYFHQNNWYQTDRCLGAPPNTARLSFEYIQSGNDKYACYGGCSSNCDTHVRNVLSEIFIR